MRSRLPAGAAVLDCDAMSRDKDAEHREQVAVVKVLRDSGAVFTSSLNGMRLSPRLRMRASAEGMEAGEPDLCIYSRPPAFPDCCGMMIEMKVPGLKPKTSAAIARFGGASKHQKERLRLLQSLGWHCVVGYGAIDAIGKLQAAGYPLQVF